MPVSGLDRLVGLGATLSERLTVGGRPCHHGVVLLSVGCHDGGEVRCFVHETIIGTGWVDSRAMVDSSAIDPKHQMSDGVGVAVSATPGDRFTCRGAHPNHAGLTPQLTDPESVVHIGRPVAPVRIELTPCGGLHCDGVAHVVSFELKSL